MNSVLEQLMKVPTIEIMQCAAKPTITEHGLMNMKAVRSCLIVAGKEVKLKDKKRMLQYTSEAGIGSGRKCFSRDKRISE